MDLVANSLSKRFEALVVELDESFAVFPSDDGNLIAIAENHKLLAGAVPYLGKASGLGLKIAAWGRIGAILGINPAIVE